MQVAPETPTTRRRSRPRLVRPAAAVVAAGVLALAGRSLRAQSAQSQPGAAARQPATGSDATAAAFVGSWDLAVSNQVPDYSRVVLTVARADSGLTAAFTLGPPGRARSVRVQGDSLVILWIVDPAANEGEYRLTLRAKGDSASGTWAGPEGGGALAGRRGRP